MTEYSVEGCNYGTAEVVNKGITITSIVNNKPIFDLPLDKVALCIVPANNKDDLEIQFTETDGKKHEDMLLHMTLHFPEEEDEETNETAAELFQKSVMGTGIIKSLTGDIIAEFSKEQGNFVYPRGKYNIKMTASLFHLQGAQYSYKINYADIKQLYLLPRFDESQNVTFLITLEKPIRQGNQKYECLAIETHTALETMELNVTEDDCINLYDGQLSPVMNKKMAHLFGHLFKVLSQKKVLTRKKDDGGFLSNRDEWCIRCSTKANEGILFPLSKSFVFMHKPCFVVPYEDIDKIEFLRFEPAANAATRNFDMVLHMSKDFQGAKKFEFYSLDRSEYYPLSDFLKSKRLNVQEPEAVASRARGRGGDEGGLLDALGGDEDSEEGDSEDGDYQSNQSSDDSSGGSDVSGSDEDGEQQVSKKKRKKAPKKSRSSDGEKDGKKKKKKKDPNAPKRPLSSYLLFSAAERPKVVEENPGLSMGEISKVIGARWKEIDAESKADFEEKARADKKRYENEMAEYRKNGGGDNDED